MEWSAGTVDPGAVGRHPAGPPPEPGAGRGLGTQVWDGAVAVLGWIALRVYPFALIVGLWWLLAALGVLGNEFVMPPPDRVFDQAKTLISEGELLQPAWITMQRVIIAYLLAVAAGIVLGTLIGRRRGVRLALRPVAQFLFPTPKVALYPAMLIIFGLGATSKIAFGFSEAFFPVLLATAAATSQVEPRLVWSALALGSSRAGTLRKVIVPAALPGILTGARIGLVGAIVGVFLGEMIAGSDGLGRLMAASYRTLDTANMYVAIISISLIGFTLDRTLLLIRGRLLTWSAEEGR